MEFAERSGGILLFVVLTTLLSVLGDTGNKPCTDSDGSVIPHGQNFTPDFYDACKTCTCDNGYPILCRTAACSPPPGCKQTKPIPRTCCQFTCKDGDGNDSQPPSVNLNTTVNGKPTTDEDNITNLSLRLVASTVTSFLVLALLLFMVHRLRQRRLMLAMRRFEAQARQQRGEEDDVDHYIPAAFLHIECPPYEDPPPPYSPPKPPHILPEDSPPPYQEVENNDSSDLDANANVSNNNNNNDQSCTQHRQENGVNPPAAGIDHDQHVPNVNSSSNIIDIVDTFSGSSEVSSGDLCNSSAARGRNYTSSGREDETEMKMIFRRESCPLERNIAPFHQDYSLFVSGAARSSANNASNQPPQKETFCQNFTNEASASQEVRQRNSEGYGGGSRGGSRGVRKTGRSCSFSFTHSPEEDISMSGIALTPMSHSYHATTADSGVQTRGSYTASLSRHRARAANVNAERTKNTLTEEAEVSPEQRMVTKPMAKCNASMQQSHRLLQAELRRHLPPTIVSTTEGQQEKARSPGNVAASNHGDPAGSNHRKDDNSPPGPDGGISSCSPEHSAEVSSHLPRSQSVTSTFSVCSETGEVRLKRALAEADHSVLQSDSQYPAHSIGKSSPIQSSLAAPTDHTPDSSSHDNPSSLPNYTFPTSATISPNLGNPFCANRSELQASRARTVAAGTAGCRRSVPNPPSQELRTGASVSNGRPHTAKPKHKKIHFVPLEKSKTFKSKKEKGKGSKKGETDQSVHHHNSSSHANSFPHPHLMAAQESSEPRMHQPWLADILRGRLSTNAPSVKQYGFLDNFAPGPPEDGYLDSASKNADAARDMCAGGGGGNGHRPVAHPSHSLPHKLHGHSSATPHHSVGHRRQFSHGDKLTHANPAASRPKHKLRPLSGGPIVEPGLDPVDPAAALPLNSVARRRVKTLHLKKSRQSYPALDSAQAGHKKMNCVDLGFVEPSPDLGRTVCADTDLATHTLPSKRRAIDRGCDAVGLAPGPSTVLEGQMSSYV